MFSAEGGLGSAIGSRLFGMRLTQVLLLLFVCSVLSSCAHRSTRDSTSESGLASWYGPRFHGRKTASGEIYNMYEMTAAHRTLPMGTRVRVQCKSTGKDVTVRINDRGPHVKNRIIDLSFQAAKALGLIDRGLVEVSVVRLD